MPELNRSFIKGKMNKDLDERLLPPNEYRDAMNISVSTSEDSDVGAIENLLSTKFLDNKVYLRPKNTKVNGRFDFDTSSYLNAGIKNSDGLTYKYPPAEVVGSKEDTTEDRIYYFVKDAAGFVASTSSDGNTIYTGVRSDSIIEATPNSLNYRFEGQSIIPVFTDAYEVRIAVAAFSSSSKIATFANGTSEKLTGIEPGMTVDAINSSGNSIWAGTYDNVIVTAAHIRFLTQSTSDSDYHRLRLVFNKDVALSSAQVNEGAVLVFKKPRILNFTSGQEATYTDANGNSVLSPTPSNSMITAIDVFDGLLFFTDGRNEPKKINILRSIKGTHNVGGIQTNFGGIFATTKLKIPKTSASTLESTAWNTSYDPSSESTGINEPMTEKHITVIRPAPLMPPRLFMSNDARDTDVFSSTTNITTGNINLGASGTNAKNATVGTEINIPTTATHEFVIGDDVTVLDSSSNSHGIRGTITSITPIGTAPGITVQVTSITFVSPLSALPTVEEAHNIDRIQSEDEKLFKENFVRFAYRYVYADGEVSSLSPFSNPAFLPRAYSYDSKEAFNKGMENDVALLKLQNFAPQNMPLDAVGVDIFYKEDVSTNIYFVRNIKGCKLLPDSANDKEFNNPGFVNEDLFTHASYSGWATPVNKGSITMDSEQFGSTIPSNQLLRSYDNVPKTAKAQAISANRLIYANYTQAYDLFTGEIDVSDGSPKPLRPSVDLSIRNVAAIDTSQPQTSIKSQRTYQIGVVYKGPHGRETSVLIDRNTSITSSIDLSDQQLKLATTINSLAPTWSTHYKIYIKETSNEYYNLVLHRSYGVSEGEANEDFVILSFQSADRNKIQEGDFISLKKKRGGSAMTYASVTNKIKVLDIFNEAPDEIEANAQEKEGKFFVKIKDIDTLTSGTGGGITTTASPATGTSTDPAVFEVLPSPDRDVNLYYEASQCYPIELTEDTICEWVNPGDQVIGFDYVANASGSVRLSSSDTAFVDTIVYDHDKQAWGLTFKRQNGGAVTFDFQADAYLGTLHFKQKDGSFNISQIHFENGAGSYDDSSTPGVSSGSSDDGADNATIFIKRFTHANAVDPTIVCNVVLPWFNCYSFGNGVESDRIRDDFNAPTLANGVKASTVFENYKEEKREHGFIFSGIYNSTSGVNRLNEFIQAEPITKDLNPIYGSIQGLVARDSDIVAFCEDKVIKVLANKNALFNADGNTNITSNTAVLGTAIPFSGEFGVAFNPESIVQSGYRVYFADKVRGAVLRLSNDGLTPISEYGMSDYFKDTLKDAGACIGSFNDRLGEYDISIHSRPSSSLTKTVNTLSFNEKSNGWSSFRSYAPESGLSLDGEYYTFKFGNIYEHSLSSIRNSFYGVVSFTASGISAGASTITLQSPINPNISVGDTVFSSNQSAGDSYASNGIIPSDTTITNISNNVITISNNTTAASPGTVIVTEGLFSNSTVTTIFNDAPSSVKSFQYLKYEGTQSRILKPDTTALNSGSAVSSGSSASITLAASNSAIATGQTVLVGAGVEVGTVQSISGTALTLTANVATTVGAGATLSFVDQQYYNNSAKKGWFASSVETDLQSGKVLEFINKEGKWFNYFKGVTSSFTNKTFDTAASGNIDSQEFSVQGIARSNGVPTVKVGDTTPGTVYHIKVDTDEAPDVAGETNVYTANNFGVDGVVSIANSNDTSTGTITFTPSQSPSTFLTISPTEGVGIAASEFFVRNGSAGSVADAASGTTFTHGTNGITLNSTGGDKPLHSVIFTDTGTAFDPTNEVKMSVVFADTTLSSDLQYIIPIKRTEGKARAIPVDTHLANININFYDSANTIFPFIESTALVNGDVSSDATVIIDESPVGTGVTSDTLGNFSAGDNVTGTGVDAGQTVASITNATTFELSSADTISNNTTISFSGVTAGDQYTSIGTSNGLQTGSSQLKTFSVNTTGSPFVDTSNNICVIQVSAGTNRKFASSTIQGADGFTDTGGFNTLQVQPASHTSFVSVSQEFINDGSSRPITLKITVSINPPSGFDNQETTITLGGKFTEGITTSI